MSNHHSKMFTKESQIRFPLSWIAPNFTNACNISKKNARKHR